MELNLKCKTIILYISALRFKSYVYLNTVSVVNLYMLYTKHISESNVNSNFKHSRKKRAYLININK